jgi:hypothetical protein
MEDQKSDLATTAEFTPELSQQHSSDDDQIHNY